MGDETFTERDRTEAESAEMRAWGDRLEEIGHLYRYTTLVGDGMTWFENLALTSEMYFTPYHKLNDPLDGTVRPIFDDASADQIRNFWLGWFAEQGKTPSPTDLAQVEHHVAHAHDPDALARVRAIHDEEIATLGVRCFSELPDATSMWDQYGDAHRGVCLRFRTHLMMGWGGIPPIPVAYEDACPSFYQDTRFKRVRAMVATKTNDWSHEQEWRMVRPHGPMTFPPAALDGVVMGCRIDPNDEDRVRVVLAKRELPVELLKAREAEGEFKLIIESA